MSASTTPNPTPAAKPQVSAREQKLAQAVLKTNSANLMGRIANLHGRGFIDDTIRKEWEAEVGAIKLSASDVSDDGAIKPSGVALKITALERVAKTGKPGSFAKPSTKPAPAARQNKPISTAVALSAAEEEVLDPPYGGEETDNRPLNHSIVDRLSGGRYGAYRAKQQAENGAA